MKLLGNIALRLALVLMPVMAIWATFFYFRIVEEVRDETDDALEDYSAVVVMRFLAGELDNYDQVLGSSRHDAGSNNSYSITPISPETAASTAHISYRDEMTYIKEKRETEPARILTTIFQDCDDNWYCLEVSTPTIEKEDLTETILKWIISLFLGLFIITIILVLWAIRHGMSSLYDILRWLGDYAPGQKAEPVPSDTNITEFKQLSKALQEATDRSERLFEQQKQFIGNASHELQTPLAVLGGKLEWMLDKGNLNEEQMGEVVGLLRTQRQLVHLNKDLLLLAKIDNGQFPESVDVDICSIIRESAETYGEIFEGKDINCEMSLPETFIVNMNSSLASVLITNILRNAFIHSEQGAKVSVTAEGRTISVCNDGKAPLDGNRIFDRFYQGSKREGSTGLGLAIAKAIADSYGASIIYEYSGGRHCFRIIFDETVRIKC